jgi:hypothetical protein
MFEIVEKIETGEAESSRRLLPFKFPNRATAIEYIEMLQAQFTHRGRNEEQDHWWARNEGAVEMYRWWIEE